MDDIVQKSAKGSEYFKDMYYKVFDSARHQIIFFYRDNSQLIWNGKDIHGASKITEFLASLPVTRHTIHSLDSHPIPNQDKNLGQNLLVTVSGNVTYGTSNARPFTQTLILAEDGTGNFFILHDCFRLSA